MKHSNLAAAQACYSDLQQALKAVPSYSAGVANHEERATAKDAIQKLIESKGGAVRARFPVTTIRLFGFRASSTSGLEGAVRNWLSQVTTAAMTANMGGQADRR